MWRCPVCEKENKTMQCSFCGFDGSRDYEHYPSLGRVAPAVDTVARRRKALKEKQDHILSCPSCGGGLFSVDFENQTYICSNCGCRFSGPDKKDIRILKKTGKAAEEKQKTGSEKHKLALWLSELRKRMQDKEATSRRGKLEICTLWMGLILLCVLLLLAFTHSEKSDFPSVLLIIILFMEIHLWKKGFNCPKWLKWMWEWWRFDTSKAKGMEAFFLSMVNSLIAMTLDSLKVLYFIMVFLGGLFGAVGPFVVIADLVCGNSSFLETIAELALSISFLYIALWHIGNLRNR